VGISLHSGFGVSKKVVVYYKLSMGQGDADGQCNCDFCLGTGFGLSNGVVKKAEYYKLAADQAHATGQHNYGTCLPDVVNAAEYFRMSGTQNENLGLYNYAWCLETGTGVGRDRARAAKYYKKAEDAGRVQTHAAHVCCTT
jgi:TPR repeat protein